MADDPQEPLDKAIIRRKGGFNLQDYMRIRQEVENLAREESRLQEGKRKIDLVTTLPPKHKEKDHERNDRLSSSTTPSTGSDVLQQLEAVGSMLLKKLEAFGIRYQCDATVKFGMSEIRQAFCKSRARWKSAYENATKEIGDLSKTLEIQESEFKNTLKELTNSHEEEKLKFHKEAEAARAKYLISLKKVKSTDKKSRDSDLKELEAKMKEEHEQSMKSLEAKLKSDYEDQIKQIQAECAEKLRKEQETNTEKLRKEREENSKKSQRISAQLVQLEDQAGKMLKRKSEKLATALTRVKELEDALAKLHETCSSGQKEIRNKLAEERKKTRAASKQADLLKDRLEAQTKEERKRRETEATAAEKLAEQLKILDQRRKDETKRLKQKHQEELNMIHEKIKHVIEGKDTQIRSLQKQAERLKLKVVKLEQYLLAQKDNL